MPEMVINLTDTDIKLALHYFYRRSILEINQFSDKRVCGKISEEKGNIIIIC